MLGRQTTGSVVCVACGYLVGVNDDRCYNCGRRNPGLWGYATAVRQLGSDMGFIPFVIGLSVVMYAMTLIGSRGDIGAGSLLTILSPNTTMLLLFGASGAVPVFLLDRWWTVLSAAWLHGGLIHIFFNMYWVRQIGPAVAELYGPGRLVIIYTVGAIAGFALSSFAGAYFDFMPFRALRGAQLTVGASAPIFGLFGALVYYGRRTGSSATYRMAIQYVLFMGLFGSEDHRFDPDEVRVVQALADVATIGLLQQRSIADAEGMTEQLQVALNSRIVIEQAKGAVARTFGHGGIDREKSARALERDGERGLARRSGRRGRLVPDRARESRVRDIATGRRREPAGPEARARCRGGWRQ